MISSDTRLALIDQATDLARAGKLSPTTLTAFAQHLRRSDLDVRQWHRCGDFATSAGMTDHQARTAVGQLVRHGLLERDVVSRRVRGQDARYTVYRLAPTEGDALAEPVTIPLNECMLIGGGSITGKRSPAPVRLRRIAEGAGQ
ncbi:hypothetical protein ACPCSC_30355 [Streptomyces lavendulocolor]|uniref:hypothetical protein n=1 Tax=Streptomyces lavendulocolor TaxID=67316 RepID=UPI003C2DCFD0